MTAEISHDDTVARPDRWQQERLGVGAKTDRVPRLIEQARGMNAVASQSRHERLRLAMTMRHLGDRTLAERAAPRIGVMFGLVQVASPKTSRPGSTLS